MTPAELSVLAVALPLIGAVAIAALDRHPNLRDAASLVVATALFLAVAGLVPDVLAGGRANVAPIELLPGLAIRLTVEPLGVLFALVAAFLWIVTTVYSIGYMRANAEAHQTRYYACFAVALASTMGIALAGNLLTLFIAYELLTLSTYPLVTHHGDEAARRAGRTYLGLLLGTSIGLLLLAMLWTWTAAGTLDFTPGGILAGKIGDPLAGVLLLLYLYGIGKAALMPLHRWLPAGMVAPTPVSALLHAVAVVNAGVFTVLKVVVYIFGIDMLAGIAGAAWLIWVAGFSVLMASIVALRQDNLKRRLAYSTISQLAYVLLAAAVLTPISAIGAALHIATHGFGKITLFFAAGSIYTAARKTEVSQLDGIGRRMPWTMAAFAIGALSMIGLPPTAGFVSKWVMLSGAVEADNILAIAVIVLSTLLNAAYLLPIVHAAYFRAPMPGGPEHGEAPLPMLIALGVAAAGTMLLFGMPDLALALARGMVGESQ